jgi:hypothetical protein
MVISPSFRALAGRARQRGAAVFVVVLVITLLMGIGLFASRSSALATSAAGYGRQSTQTHYWTDYAMLNVTAEMSTTGASAHLQEMQSLAYVQPNLALCSNVALCSAEATVTSPTFYVFSYSELEGDLQGNLLLLPTVTPVPGSLGPGGLNGAGLGGIRAQIHVYMTDVGHAPPVAGMQLGGAGNAVAPSYCSVTLSGHGLVYPSPGNGSGLVFDPNGDPTHDDMTAASVEDLRAHLVVGPSNQCPSQ